METMTLQMPDGLDLSLAVFDLENPLAVVQIIHGAKEHKERYCEFARFLNGCGLAVVASDSRGHGDSIDERYPRGHMERCSEMIDDQYRITCFIRERHPGVPLYIFGHSFGSLLARVYLQKHDDEVEKLVLSGTASHVGAVDFGLFLGKRLSSRRGAKKYTRFLRKIGKLYDDSWVCSDEKVLEEVRKDELSAYPYTMGAILTIFEADSELNKLEKYQVKKPGLKILSVSGEDDPVTGGMRGLKKSIRLLREIGYHNIKFIVYRKMRHEVINEIGKEKVYRDIRSFLLDEPPHT